MLKNFLQELKDGKLLTIDGELRQNQNHCTITIPIVADSMLEELSNYSVHGVIEGSPEITIYFKNASLIRGYGYLSREPVAMCKGSDRFFVGVAWNVFDQDKKIYIIDNSLNLTGEVPTKISSPVAMVNFEDTIIVMDSNGYIESINVATGESNYYIQPKVFDSYGDYRRVARIMYCNGYIYALKSYGYTYTEGSGQNTGSSYGGLLKIDPKDGSIVSTLVNVNSGLNAPKYPALDLAEKDDNLYILGTGDECIVYDADGNFIREIHKPDTMQSDLGLKKMVVIGDDLSFFSKSYNAYLTSSDTGDFIGIAGRNNFENSNLIKPEANSIMQLGLCCPYDDNSILHYDVTNKSLSTIYKTNNIQYVASCDTSNIVWSEYPIVDGKWTTNVWEDASKNNAIVGV